MPTWPSALGSTTTSSVGFPGMNSTTSAITAPANNAPIYLQPGIVDLDYELRAAHAHDGGRRMHPHRVRRLLDHLAGDYGERALLQGRVELPGMGGAVE